MARISHGTVRDIAAQVGSETGWRRVGDGSETARRRVGDGVGDGSETGRGGDGSCPDRQPQ